MNLSLNFHFYALLFRADIRRLFLVKDYLDMEIIGTTIDDAVGRLSIKQRKSYTYPYQAGQ